MGKFKKKCLSKQKKMKGNAINFKKKIEELSNDGIVDL